MQVAVAHPLPAELEDELATIRRAPLAAIGFGEKAYFPYDLVEGKQLLAAREANVVPRLIDEALDRRNDRIFRWVILQIMALRSEDAVDDALIAALNEPATRPLAAYFLGRAGFKGYPSRDRTSVALLLRALAAHIDDPGTYVDPWYRVSRSTADLVLAAFVRIAGPDAFVFVDSANRDTVGYALDFPDVERPGLLAQVKRRAGSH